MSDTSRIIETRAFGYRFRSRTEARWAVFFDAAGIAFEYEKEGYKLGSAGLYLPDFWLPEQELWVEIKGETPDEAEIEKAQRLSQITGHTCAIFSGTPWFNYAERYFMVYAGGPEEGEDEYHVADIGFQTGGYERIPHVDPSRNFMEQFGRWAFSCYDGEDGTQHPIQLMAMVMDHRLPAAVNQRVAAAYLTAREARFEHGEKPGASA